VNRGEVWLVASPFAPGREQQGQRPAAVVQDDAYGRRSPLVLLVPLTSQLRSVSPPRCVPIPRGRADWTCREIELRRLAGLRS
jgi:mRNA-degrading endonuclease toxin of MazEF toxin-antitoxin module